MRTWTPDQLTELRRHARLTAAAFDLGALAHHAGRTRREVNLALDALLGRAPEDAAAALAAAAPPEPEGGGGLMARVRRLFG